MTGTRGMGRRRGTRGKTALVDGYPEGAIPNQEPVQTPTVRIEIPQAQTEVIAGSADDPAEAAVAAEFDRYAREPVPDLGSPDPADRTEWFRLKGGDESTFRATVADLDAMWLLDTSLPAPVPTAPEAAEDATSSGSGSAPPAGGEAAETTAPPSADPEPVSTEDEPDAESDCAEGGETA
jgi:hypothetical protein